MRTISFLWIILITNQLFTQKSNDFQFPFSVIDGVKINVDFPLYNCMIYEYHSQINEMRNSKYKFKLTDIEKKVFKSYSYYTNPFCNILNNKSANYKYCIKQIDVKADKNFPFEKGSIKILKYRNDTGYIYIKDTVHSQKLNFKVKSSFLSIVKDAIKFGELTIYETNKELDMKIQPELAKKIDSNFHKIRYLRIKEAVYYDYINHCYKPHILGVGLIIDSNQYWFYGPELKWVLSFYSVERYSFNSYDSWNKIIENGMYESKIIYESKTQNHEEFENYSNNDINNGLHRNEYDCYWNLHQLKIVHFNKNNIQYPHRFKISPQLNGIKEFRDSLNNIIAKIEFDHGVANGNYNSFYPNNTKKQTGTFVHEKKHGEWISYYPSGNVMAKRNYSYGLPDGKQYVYYDNNKVLMEYNFENGMLNGDFIRFDSKGKLLEKGSFKDELITGKWEINYHIPNHYMKLIEENPNYEWKFPVNEIVNQTLNYKLEFEQYNNGIGFYQRDVRYKK